MSYASLAVSYAVGETQQAASLQSADETEIWEGNFEGNLKRVGEEIWCGIV